MRKASLVLALVACAAPCLSLAEHREPPADIASPTAADATRPEDGDNETGKSGFGQVMSVLTTLLQEAAAKQAADGPSNASALLSSDQSAVTITVTPVAGRSTFFVDKPRGGPGSAISTPLPRVAATNIEAHSAQQGAQMAMQADGIVPD